MYYKLDSSEFCGYQAHPVFAREGAAVCQGQPRHKKCLRTTKNLGK